MKSLIKMIPSHKWIRNMDNGTMEFVDSTHRVTGNVTKENMEVKEAIVLDPGSTLTIKGPLVAESLVLGYGSTLFALGHVSTTDIELGNKCKIVTRESISAIGVSMCHNSTLDASAMKVKNDFIVDSNCNVLLANGLICSNLEIEGLSKVQVEGTLMSKKSTKIGHRSSLKAGRVNCSSLVMSPYSELYVRESVSADNTNIGPHSKILTNGGVSVVGKLNLSNGSKIETQDLEIGEAKFESESEAIVLGTMKAQGGLSILGRSEVVTGSLIVKSVNIQHDSILRVTKGNTKTKTIRVDASFLSTSGSLEVEGGLGISPNSLVNLGGDLVSGSVLVGNNSSLCVCGNAKVLYICAHSDSSLYCGSMAINEENKKVNKENNKGESTRGLSAYENCKVCVGGDATIRGFIRMAYKARLDVLGSLDFSGTLCMAVERLGKSAQKSEAIIRVLKDLSIREYDISTDQFIVDSEVSVGRNIHYDKSNVRLVSLVTRLLADGLLSQGC